jgi:hypothetical protein
MICALPPTRAAFLEITARVARPAFLFNRCMMKMERRGGYISW